MVSPTYMEPRAIEREPLGSPAPLRPRSRWLLRAALVLAWVVGFGGGYASCGSLAYYRTPQALAPSSPNPTTFEDIAVAARTKFRSTRLPLSIAWLLVSAVLVLGAARTLARRPGGLPLLRQACVVVSLLAVVDFAVSGPERAFLVEQLALLRARQLEKLPPDMTREAFTQTARAAGRVGIALRFFAEVAFFSALAMALGRKAVASELAPREIAPVPPPEDDEG